MGILSLLSFFLPFILSFLPLVTLRYLDSFPTIFFFQFSHSLSENYIQALLLFGYGIGKFSLIVFLLNYIDFVFLASSFNFRGRYCFMFILLNANHAVRWLSWHWAQFLLLDVDFTFSFFWEMSILRPATRPEVYSVPMDFC